MSAELLTSTGMQLLLLATLIALAGTAGIFFLVQVGRIETPRIVTGASLLFVVGGITVAVIASQQSSAQARWADRVPASVHRG